MTEKPTEHPKKNAYFTLDTHLAEMCCSSGHRIKTIIGKLI